MRRFNLEWILIALIGALFLIAGAGWWLRGANADQPSQTTSPIANATTIFQPVLSQLGRAQVPLRLPTYIPSRGQRQSSESLPVYASVDSVESGSYAVVLGYSKDCNGSNACRLGAVIGEVQPTKSAQDDYTESDYLYPDGRSEEPVAQVTLANGITGTFLPWRCATNCTDAQVVWDENGYRYSVGIKLGDRDSLVKMANSAIENGSANGRGAQ
ncbi:hypothetical protein NDI45_22760 [Leptolyngbya sp. GB1-A1]|uniref:hypothetical protein n=1 Tax=Leptolyngbya sp. GB1-A1 TaxID=2933908 RepID=UPI0032976908